MTEWQTWENMPPTPGRYLITISLGARRRTMIAKWPGNGSRRWIVEGEDIDGYVIAWAPVPRAFEGKAEHSIGVAISRD